MAVWAAAAAAEHTALPAVIEPIEIINSRSFGAKKPKTIKIIYDRNWILSCNMRSQTPVTRHRPQTNFLTPTPKQDSSSSAPDKKSALRRAPPSSCVRLNSPHRRASSHMFQQADGCQNKEVFLLFFFFVSWPRYLRLSFTSVISANSLSRSTIQPRPLQGRVQGEVHTQRRMITFTK